ncbi:MAG: hypothetical protein ACR2QO_18675 [Acidimicrobiales bacterium]
MLAAVIVGCGAGASREAAIESFQNTNPEATDEQAACVVDGLIDRYGLDDLDTQLGTVPLDAAFEEDQFREMFVCGVDGDWRADITEQLIGNGVAAEDAPCVSDELFATMSDDDIGVLLTGDITESFSDTFYDALQSCGALNP